MNRNRNIVLVIPYFGKLPDIAHLFFSSAGVNPQMRFLLFTNQKKPDNLPENVEYYSISLRQFNQLASAKLEIKVHVVYPYKLCDLKPMYGKIFEDYLTGSDFWGYCDLDLIFGNFHEFITDEILDKFDVVSSRKDSLAGNFTLYRNIPELNNLYQKSDCWKEIIRHNQWVHSFPERFKPEGKPVSKSYWYRLINLFHKPVFAKTEIPDMNSVLSRNLDIKVYYGNFLLSDMLLKNSQTIDWKIVWEDGKLKDIINNTSILYFHFYFLKNRKDYAIKYQGTRNKISKIEISAKGIEVY
jgi:hypothetical protein